MVLVVAICPVFLVFKIFKPWWVCKKPPEIVFLLYTSHRICRCFDPQLHAISQEVLDFAVVGKALISCVVCLAKR